MKKNPKKSTLKSARFTASGMRASLAQRYSLRWHGFFLGTLTMAITWLVSTGLFRWGVESLAVRYGLAFVAGYIAYIGLLRLWAHYVCSPHRPKSNISNDSGAGDAVEFAGHAVDGLIGHGRLVSNTANAFASGRGGDFGGGGATSDWNSSDTSGNTDAMGELVGGAFKGAGELISESDDGAVVVIPIVAIFIMALLVFMGLGSIAFLYFGSEVLLAVAVQLAFSYTSSNAAVKIAREGWLGSVWRITWKPMFGALMCAVALGFMCDVFVPNANTMAEVVRGLHAAF